MSFGQYQFLPWARRGLSAYISEPDTLGKSAATVVERATVHLSVEVNADAAQGAATDFQMIGPGDIVGVHAEMIIRTEPLDAVTGYEPNYLPYVEFYDEDFPWRYTPARQVDTTDGSIPGGRLRPWLALIVLKANEFEDTKRRQPLPSIKVTNPAALPPQDELHLWAHAHNNQPNTQTLLEDFIESLENDYKKDPDGLYSRILCPRHLEADTLYHAFLVPSYETGRLSGLGRPIKDTKAQQPSWGPGAGDAELPVYHRWFFRTGDNFDFESLVKLLEPRIMDDKVGTRPMDSSRPGYVKAVGSGEVTPLDPQIVYLEGAVLAPQTKPRPELLTIAQPFVSELTDLVKLNKTNVQNTTEDPIVTVPFYGIYHAMEVLNSLPDFDPANVVDGAGKDTTKWQNELNRDPRWRVAAGFGTRMVQENQEKFMDAAWKQLKAVLEANKKLSAAQLNAKVANKLHEKHFMPLAEEKMLSMTRSVSARVPMVEEVTEKAVIDPTVFSGPHLKTRDTVKSAIQLGALPAAALSHPFRRILRNQSKMLRLLEKSAIQIPDINRPAESVPRAVAGPPITRNFNAQVVKNAVDGLNQRVITAAPEIKFSALTNLTKGSLPVPASADAIKVWSIKSNTDDDFIYNLPDFKGGLPDVDKWRFVFGPQINTPGVFNNIDPTSGFLGGMTDFSAIFQAPIIKSVAAPRAPAAPLADFSDAFKDMNIRKAFATPIVPKPSIEVDKISNATKLYVRPDAAFQRMLAHTIAFGGAKNKVTEDFLPVMAYPDFNEPTYEFLVKIDKELLLPNLDLIPPNTISLLRTNQKFIESYLVGLNYEMGRELLWREYPTDMRGSYFRQFWDVRGIVAPTTTALGAENAKDIKPIHTWLDPTKPLRWPLGRHNARDAQGDASQLVFVVRGELLKKFPNTVIYAQKAIIKDGKKVINRNLTAAEFKDDILFPIYKAEIDPDIKLFGFDLTIEQAAGTEKSAAPNDTDNLGWFFIIAEVPGEPRFGMDLTFVPNKPDQAKWTWNDLSWESFNGQKLDFIRADIAPNFATHDDEDTVVVENPNNNGTWARSSADMATILFQRPVMIATHASEMLDKDILDDNKALNAPQAVVKLGAHAKESLKKIV